MQWFMCFLACCFIFLSFWSLFLLLNLLSTNALSVRWTNTAQNDNNTTAISFDPIFAMLNINEAVFPTAKGTAVQTHTREGK